jgi:putative ABC transport system permease protein
MMISVTERTREIGVRKALGATAGTIRWQFLVEAATLTSIGALIGLAVGATLAWVIRANSSIPASLPASIVATALLASAVTGWRSGCCPPSALRNSIRSKPSVTSRQTARALRRCPSAGTRTVARESIAHGLHGCWASWCPSAFLVAVVAIIQGMNAYVKENIADAMIGTNTFQVRRLPISSGSSPTDEFRLLRRRPRVARARRRRRASGTSGCGGDQHPVGLAHAQADMIWRKPHARRRPDSWCHRRIPVVQDYKFNRRPAADRHRRARRRNVVVIGSDVATLLFDNGDAIDQEVRVMGKRFTVVGVVGRKGRMLGQSFDGFALMPITVFESIYGLRQTTTISVKMHEAADIGPAMARAQGGDAPWRAVCDPANATTSTWAPQKHLWTSRKQLTRVLFAVVPAVVAIGILVGGIVIMNIMLMAVTERTHENRRCARRFGATSADVRRTISSRSRSHLP